MKRIILFRFLSALLISGSAVAEEARIANWWVSGTRDCNKNSVQLIQNGNAYSFLFNQFGPQLEENEQQSVDVKVCKITVKFELPKDTCIYQIDQLLSGGLIKTEGARGRFHFTARLNGINRVQQKTLWDFGTAISPEDPESIVTYSLTQPTTCLRLRYQTYRAELFFSASKKQRRDFFLGAIDSLDQGLSLRVRTR